MSAIISSCGAYRYRLERKLGPISIPAITAAIIMVNPSTADAETDDATIRKLRGFGERNGWSKIIVGNLFAYRATDVRELASAADPIGPDNDDHLGRIIGEADELIFAWGPTGKLPLRFRSRWTVARDLAAALDRVPQSIGPTAQDGHPCHPLMLGYSTPLRPWLGPELSKLMQ